MNKMLIKDVNVYNNAKGVFEKDMQILIENGMITETGTDIRCAESGIKTVSYKGKYVIPGLFDSHTHLAILAALDMRTLKEIMKKFASADMTDSEESQKLILEQFVKCGVTQVRDVGGPIDVLRAMKEKINEGMIKGPDFFYAGPMLEKSPLTWEGKNKELPGFTVSVNSEKDAEDIIRVIKEEGASLVKTFGKFDPEVYEKLFEEAQKAGLPVTHDPGAIFFHRMPMDKAMELGVKCIEHAKAPLPVILNDELEAEHSRIMKESKKGDKKRFLRTVMKDPLNAVSDEKLDRLAEKMVDGDVLICPTLIVLKEHLRHVTEQEEGMKTGNLLKRIIYLFVKGKMSQMRKIMGSMDKLSDYMAGRLIGKGVKILAGQDGVSPDAVYDELELLHGCGLSEKEIINSATIYPAQWLRIDDKYGEIKKDRIANMVVLNSDPLADIKNMRDIHVVLKDGIVIDL